MATNKEIVKVLKVETKGSDVSVKTLRQEISALRDVLLNTEKGTEEYNQAVQQIKANQDLLSQAMNATKTEATALEGSYNALTQKLAELKKAWKATNDEVERSKLTEEINEVKNALKDLDNSIGNYQSNVGNYANSFKEAMNDAQGTVEPLKAKFESVQKIASGLASGFAAVQGVTALMGIENEKLEKTFVKLQAAMAIAQGIGGLGDLVEGVSKAKVAFSGAISGVKTFIMSLRGIKLAIASTGIGLLVVAIGMLVEHLMSMADAEDKVAKGAEDIEKARKKAENEVKGIKDKSETALSEKVLETWDEAKERMEKLGIATDDAAKIMDGFQNKVDSLETQTKIDELEKLTEVMSGYKKDLEMLNDGQIQFRKDTTVIDGFSPGPIQIPRRKRTTTIDDEATEKAKKEALASLKVVQEAVLTAKEELMVVEQKNILKEQEQQQKRIEDWKKIQEKLDEIQLKAHQKTIDTEKEEITELTNKYEEEKALLVKYGRDTAKLTEAYEKERQEIIDRYAKEREEKQKERNEKLFREAVNAYNKGMLTTDLQQDSAENEVNRKEIDESPKYTTLGFEIDKTQDNEAASIQLEIDKLKELMSIREQYHQQRMQEIDELMNAEGISEEEKAQLEMEKMSLEHQYTEQKKEDAANLTKFEKKQEDIKIRDKKLAMQTSLDVASNIAGGLASILGENTKAGKVAATAQATIDTYKAANSAYASMAGIPIVGPALGAAAAAMAVASGIMNVKKIWSVKEDQPNNPDSSSASAAQSMVRPNISLSDVLPTQLTQNVMTDSELSELNQPTKVYVTETDIADTTNKVQVTETNASF